MKIFKNKFGLQPKQCKMRGFTLSEVLITLGIIGVVASITIPTLMGKKFEQETTSKLKKAYSTLYNAYTLTVQENGTPDTWNLIAADDLTGARNMLYMFAPYLKIAKKCDLNEGSCLPNLMYKRLNGNNYLNLSTEGVSAFVLADGSIIMAEVRSTNCTENKGGSLALQNVCGVIWVDINGFNAPNKVGVDYFGIYVTKYGLVPRGSASETVPPSPYSFDNDCKDKTTSTGYSCAAWVLYNENLDYMHCSSLSWNGPTKCQ